MKNKKLTQRFLEEKQQKLSEQRKLVKELNKSEAQAEKSDKEKNKTLLADLDKAKASLSTLEKSMKDSKPDYSNILAQPANSIKENPASVAGWRAAVSAAKLLCDQKKFKEASEILQKVINASSDSSDFYQSSGSCHVYFCFRGARKPR